MRKGRCARYLGIEWLLQRKLKGRQWVELSYSISYVSAGTGIGLPREFPESGRQLEFGEI